MFDVYIRVSRKGGREGESYISVPEQRRAIEETASRKGVTLSGFEVVEEDVSGSRKASERQLEEILSRIESGESQGLIVATQDRLSRGKLSEQAAIWERLEKADARLITGDGLDSSDSAQELLFSIRAALAREQWRQSQVKWGTARRNAIERGLHFASHVPTGYVYEKGQPLRVDEKLAPVVVGLFERRARRWNWARLANWMNEQEQTNGTANRETVRSIIHNRAYLGIAFSGSNEKRNAHPAIVTRKLWDEANSLKGTKFRGDGAMSGSMLLLSLATCDNCGHRLQVSASKWKNSESGKLERRPAYNCKNMNCDSRAFVSAAELDAHVTWQFAMMSVPLGEAVIVNEGSSDVAEAKAALEAAVYDKKKFVGNRELRRMLTDEEYNEELKVLVEVVTEAEIALELAQQVASETSLVPVAELWPTWNMETRREYV